MQRSRRMLLSCLNRAAGGVVFGGPMVCMFALGLPDYYASHNFVFVSMGTFVHKVTAPDDDDAFDADAHKHTGEATSDALITDIDANIHVPITVDADGKYLALSKCEDYEHRCSTTDPRLRFVPAIAFFSCMSKERKRYAPAKQYALNERHPEVKTHVLVELKQPVIACLTPHWKYAKMPEAFRENVLTVLAYVYTREERARKRDLYKLRKSLFGRRHASTHDVNKARRAGQIHATKRDGHKAWKAAAKKWCGQDANKAAATLYAYAQFVTTFFLPFGEHTMRMGSRVRNVTTNLFEQDDDGSVELSWRVRPVECQKTIVVLRFLAWLTSAHFGHKEGARVETNSPEALIPTPCRVRRFPCPQMNDDATTRPPDTDADSDSAESDSTKSDDDSSSDDDNPGTPHVLTWLHNLEDDASMDWTLVDVDVAARQTSQRDVDDSTTQQMHVSTCGWISNEPRGAQINPAIGQTADGHPRRLPPERVDSFVATMNKYETPDRTGTSWESCEVSCRGCLDPAWHAGPCNTVDPRHSVTDRCTRSKRNCRDVKKGDIMFVRTNRSRAQSVCSFGVVTDIYHEKVKKVKLSFGRHTDAKTLPLDDLLHLNRKTFEEHLAARTVAAFCTAYIHHCRGKAGVSGCFQKSASGQCRMGYRKMLFNNNDRWRLVDHDLDPPQNSSATTEAGQNLPTTRGAPSADETCFSRRIALAASDDLEIAKFTRRHKLFGVCQDAMLGMLANMYAIHRGNDMREQLRDEHEARLEDHAAQRAVREHDSDDDDAQADEDEELMNVESEESLARLIRPDSGAEQAVQLLNKVGVVTPGERRTAFAASHAAGITVSSNNVASTSRMREFADALQTQNERRIFEMQGGAPTAKNAGASVQQGADVHDGPRDPRDIMDTTPDTPGPLYVDTAIQHAPTASRASDDAQRLRTWEVGRPLTLEDTFETGAPDRARKTPYGKPVKARQRDGIRLFLDAFMKSANGESPEVEPLRMIIVGEPGTGKTVAVNAIRRHIASHGLEAKLRVGVYTGRGASLCSARTLHMLKGGGISNRVSDSQGPRNKAEWNGCVGFIIDEFSMVSFALLVALSRSIAVGQSLPGTPFGRVHVLLNGDPFQFSCIGGLPLYKFARDFDRLNSTDFIERLRNNVFRKKKHPARLADSVVQAIALYRQFRTVVIYNEQVRELASGARP